MQAQTQASIEELTRRVSKSVVVITSGSRDGRRDGIGTGFIISPDGLIATNYHVLGEGRSVRIQTAEGRTLEVTGVHASDRNLDLAILRVDAKDLPALELGDSDAAQQGQAVIALGNPQGLKYSVVSGIISSVREVDGRQMIQLAIPIEPGNSGGPLVDMQGRVLGIMTMKSLVTPNLGFAMTVNRLKPLLEKPNPIPMSRWLTIGALDPREWQPLFGARWRQRAGRMTVEDAGTGFGGRSLCMWQGDVPDEPLELAVTVQLDDERGAAGLAFGSDGDQRHWGFYPTAGRLRLTRFDGPDVTSWTILHDQPHRAYVAGGWNTLRVRLEDGKATCFVNDEKVVEMALGELAGKRGAGEISRHPGPVQRVSRRTRIAQDLGAAGDRRTDREASGRLARAGVAGQRAGRLAGDQCRRGFARAARAGRVAGSAGGATAYAGTVRARATSDEGTDARH